jgi:hypothetical protein
MSSCSDKERGVNGMTRKEEKGILTLLGEQELIDNDVVSIDFIRG